MKDLISAKFAAYSVFILLSVFVVFHFFVVAGVVPQDIVWGGRISSREELIRMETISILVNLIMISIAAVRARILKFRINSTILRVAFWLMFVLFSLNTLGNLLSLNDFEKYAFTPVTLLLAIFSLRLAIDKN
ncbi:MAG: hypothetical protein ACXWDO_07500 [Bacteroidia bacterium]